MQFLVNNDGSPTDKALKSPLLIAMSLDPRFKQLKIQSPAQKDSLHQIIVELLERGTSTGTSME